MRIRRRWALLLALSAGVVQWLGGQDAFHYDDFHSIVHNPHLRSLENVPRFFGDPALFSADAKQAMYRPVVLTTYALNYALDGLEPRSYRLFNIFVHALNAVLVVYLVHALARLPAIAWTAALCFAFHPLSVESVQYISSRSESLMALGLLSALLCYQRWQAAGGLHWYGLSLGAFALSILSKSVGCVGLLLLPLCDWLQGRPIVHRGRLLAYAPFLVLVGLYVSISHQVVGKAIGAPVRSYDVQLWTQLKAWIYYAWMGIMPARLSVEHQFFTSLSFMEPAVWWALLLAASLLWLGVVARQRLLVFAIAWCALALLPASVVPLIVLVNEHRLYLALVGGGMALGWLVNAVYANAPRVALSSAAVYTLLLIIMAYGRAQVWRSEEVLWDDAASKAPGMLKPHLRLGDALVGVGAYERAEAAYGRALQLRTQHPAARNNLGLLYMRQGRFDEAEVQFRTLLDVSPDIVQARLNWALLLLRRGAWREAEAAYEEALRYGDTGGDAQKKLGYIALHHRSDSQRAVGFLSAGLALHPDAPTWTALGVALRSGGENGRAEAAYRAALALDGQSADTWFNLANLYRDTDRLDLARDAYRRVAEAAGHTLVQRAVQELQLLTPQ